MEQRRPWEGFRRCEGCEAWEIDGLGYCLRHVPIEDLAEAEAVTGMRRCRKCSEVATAKSDPPACPFHVAERTERNGPATNRASTGFIESAMAEQMGEIMTEHGERLLHPPAVGDPLDELIRLVEEFKEFKQILRERLARLNMDEWRYAHNRVGEQIRTEVFLYERALERLARLLIGIAKLKIKEHQAAIETEMVGKIERALLIALAASDATPMGQQRARDVLVRELA